MRPRTLSLKRWIRACCPAQRCFRQKAWFSPKAPPPAAAGHLHVPGYRVLPRLHRAFPAAACLLLAACATHRVGDEQKALTLPQFTAPPADGAIFHTGYSQPLFGNTTAHNVGDTVTVVLQESTIAQKSSQTDTAKTTKDSLAAPTVLGNQVTIHGTPILSGSLNNANSFSGSGDSKQSDSLVGDITVTVVQRLANGNLVVQGEKYIDINQGSEYVRLEGIIRPI